MKARHLVHALGASLLALSISAAHAQASDTAAASAAAAPSAKLTKKQARAANHKLAQAVRKALYGTKGLVSSDITVLARNGVVTLDGTVPDQPQIDLAGQTAQGVSGVTSVRNNVQLYQKN
ncbi:MAG TPA: BON domain-containing protein [Pararobbsia sp.]|nr:BON domain-containing protein [Pararobbsia sp.]